MALPVAGPPVGTAGRRRTGPGCDSRIVLRLVRAIARETPELTGPIHAHEDLAEQSIPASGLTAGSEGLDRDFGHGASGLGRGEGPALEPFRGREQAPTLDDVGITSPTRHRLQRYVPAGSSAWRHPGARRQQLDDPEGVAVRIADQGREEPVAGADPTERGRGHRFGAAIDELHDPPVAGHGGRDGLEGAPERGSLPTPGPAQRRAGERVDRQEGCGLPAQHPGRGVIGGTQAREIGPGRRLARAPGGCAAAGRHDPRRGCRSQAPGNPTGLDSPTSAVAVPSPRLRRSSPSRAWTGP